MATQLVIPPLVSEEAAERRQREQAQAQQNLMNFAQMRLMAQRNQEVELDREYTKLSSALKLPGLLPAEQAQIANQMLDLVSRQFPDNPGLKGIRINPERLELWKGVFSFVDDAMKTGNPGRAEGAIEKALELGIIPGQEMGAAIERSAQVREAVGTQRADEAMRLFDPEVQGAMDRSKGRQEELGSLIVRSDQLRAAVDGPDAREGRLALEQLRRFDALKQEEMRDQAFLKENTTRIQRTDAIRAAAKSDPKVMAKLLDPTSEGFRTLRLEHYRTMPRENMSPEQLQTMHALALSLGHKSPLTEASEQKIALLDMRMRHAKAEEHHLEASLTTDAQAVDEGNKFTPQFDEILKRANDPKVPEKDVKRDIAQFGDITGAARNTSLQANTKPMNAWIDDRADLERRKQDLSRQVGTTPSESLPNLLAERDALDALIVARDAQMDLVTKYHPLEGLDHEVKLRLQQAEVDRLNTALKGTLSEAEREEFGANLKHASAEVMNEENFLKEFRKGRVQALRAVGEARSQQQAQAKRFHEQIIYGQQTMEKEEMTNLFFQRLLTEVSEGKSLTKSVTENLKHPMFKGLDIEDAKKAAGLVTAVRTPDEHSALNHAQDLFNISLATETKELTPQRIDALAAQAVKRTQEEFHIKVSTDDVKKAGRTGATSIELKMVGPTEREKMGEGRATLGALDSIERLYESKFVGRLDNLLAKFKGPLDLLTPEEAEFRAQVKQNANELLKFYAGVARTKTELKSLAETIPETWMSESQFKAALKATRGTVERKLREMGGVAQELGLRAPSTTPTFSPRKQAMYEELLKANPKDEAVIRQFLETIAE
jgi:hypothetical protein